MSRVVEMAGKVFGNLTVIRRDANSLRGQACWVVKCNCSTPVEFTVLGNNLRKGNTTGCSHIKSIRGRAAMAKLRREINDDIKAEMIGKRVGSLTVIDKFDVKSTGARWLCSCSCGRNDRVIVRTAALRSGSTKACKYCKADRMKLLPGKGMRNHLQQVYKCAAKRRGHSWELSPEQFDNLTQSTCHYCDAEPTERKHNARFNGAYKCNGVDRKDNAVGYVISNCLPCCFVCNRAKGTMTYDEFVAWLCKAGGKQLRFRAMKASV